MKKLTRTQLVAAASHLAAATVDKDPSIAQHVALLEGVKDIYELGALQFYRYLEALERLQEC
jgi:hypothetical protein